MFFSSLCHHVQVPQAVTAHSQCGHSPSIHPLNSCAWTANWLTRLDLTRLHLTRLDQTFFSILHCDIKVFKLQAESDQTRPDDCPLSACLHTHMPTKHNNQSSHPSSLTTMTPQLASSVHSLTQSELAKLAGANGAQQIYSLKGTTDLQICCLSMTKLSKIPKKKSADSHFAQVTFNRFWCGDLDKIK